MLDVTFFKKYIDKGLSVLPVKTSFVEKKNRFEGKFPCISGWQNLCVDAADDEVVDSWAKINDCSGVAICCGEASNIGCIDIDMTNYELIQRVMDVIPYTPLRVLGDRGRIGGKFIYRLTDFPSTYTAPPKAKQKVMLPNTNKTAVDIFFGSAYIVIPPSIHNINIEGEQHFYSWYDKDILNVSLDDIPVLPVDVRYKIEQVLNGETKESVLNSMAGNTDVALIDPTQHNSNRYSRMVSHASRLISERRSFDNAIQNLLTYDKKTNYHNEYFKDRSKGCVYPNNTMNAIFFYTDMLKFASSNKAASEIEVPKFDEQNFVPDNDIAWNPVIPLGVKQHIIEDMPSDLIPSQWQEFVEDIADANSVSKEVCLFYLLTQLSSLIGNKLVITAKIKNKSWEEAHNIWSIYVSPSGTRKSQVTKTLSFPMARLQTEIDSEHNDVAFQYAADENVKKITIKELKKNLEQEISTGIREGYDLHTKSRIDELTNKINEVENESKIPYKHQLHVKGTTVEKLIEIIGGNKTGTFLEYNELSQLTALFRKKGYEILRTFLLDSWDGLRPYSYQTKGSGEIFIEKNCIAMFSCVQNSIFEKELEELSRGNNDDGFYQRSFIILNDNPIAMAIDRNFNINKYIDIMKAFEKAHYLGTKEETIILTQDAYDLYMQYEQRCLTLAMESINSALGSFWSKFTGKVVKLASLIEFIKCKGSHHKEISYASMLMAVKLMERQILHIEKLFPDLIDLYCSDIIRAVRFGSIKDGITHTNLCKKFRYLDNHKTYDKVIMKLYDHNYISCLDGEIVRYYFNPEIKHQQES